MKIAARIIAAIFLLSLAVLVSSPRATAKAEMITARVYGEEAQPKPAPAPRKKRP